MNVFKEMALSIYHYESYSKFLKNKKGKVFGYGLLLMLIYVLVAYLIPGTIRMGTPDSMARSFRENVPNFELKNGTLWVDTVVDMEQSGTYIYIDTDPDYVLYDADELSGFLRGYRQAILMDSEKMIVKSNGEVQQGYFSDLGLEFSRDELEGIIPTLYVLYYIIMIFGYIWMTALFFFGVLFVALIGLIISSSMKCQLTFGQLYLMGIYSRTLPLMIKALVSFLPVQIPLFWVLNFGLSALILGLAMSKMKAQVPQNPQMPQNPGQYPPSGYQM